MTMGYCLLIKPDQINRVELAPGRALQQLYKHLGCQLVERVPLAPGIDMWIDEEMLMVEPVTNYPASILVATYNHPPQLFFGAVLVSGSTSDGETVNLSEDVAESVYKRLINVFG